MRIVLDSNVLISAFIARGICSVLFEHIIENEVLLISKDILLEFSRIMIKKIKVPEDKVNEIIDYLQKYAELIDHGKLLLPVSRDRDDDNILAVALHGKADVLVTGDNDLLVIENYKNIPILTPRQFFEKIRAQ
jgi:putative PIN family toxin of toxin-antitoxin system